MVPIGPAWSCFVPCGPMWFSWSLAIVGPLWLCIILIRPNLSRIVQVDLVWFHMAPNIYGHAWSSMVQHSATWSSMACMIRCDRCKLIGPNESNLDSFGPVLSWLVLLGPLKSGMVQYSPRCSSFISILAESKTSSTT